MPSLIELIKIYPQARTLPELQQIKLDFNKPASGTKLRPYDFSLVLNERETIKDSSVDRNISTGYIIGENRVILIQNPNDDSINFNMRDLFYSDESLGRRMDVYAGKHIDTDFEFRYIYFGASLKNLSLTNNEKNYCLYQILTARLTMRFLNESFYVFERNDIKGFLRVGGSTEKPIVSVTIFRQGDLNKAYTISFLNFNLQDTAEILSTIDFKK
jgi:hypothetical protein